MKGTNAEDTKCNTPCRPLTTEAAEAVSVGEYTNAPSSLVEARRRRVFEVVELSSLLPVLLVSVWLSRNGRLELVMVELSPSPSLLFVGREELVSV